MTDRSTLTMDGCNPECRFGIAVDELKIEREATGDAARNLRDIAERSSDHAGVEDARDSLMQLEIDNEGGFLLEAVRKNCKQACVVERILSERTNFGVAIVSKMATLKNE